MKNLATYNSFNGRRYSNPWVAKVVNGKIDFSEKVGGYTGKYNAGDAGELVVYDPKEGQVYAWGQKDYRGNSSELRYSVFVDGKFVEIEKTEISKYC